MSRKLLLIDDDNDCRRMTQRLLQRAGYDVIEAADGLAGYERVLADEPKIIITDWDMPRLNGLDLIRRVRQAGLDWYPYILLLTASDDLELGLDTGADDFLSKPIRENLLLPRVRAGERIVTLQARLNAQNQQLNLANQRLEQLATTDSLTGLLNRRAFFASAEREWRRCQRYGNPLSCLMLDIDHFKRINDTHGHPAGDAVIIALSQLLAASVRESDLVCRYGGEEFCVWLTNTPIEQARQAAARLCASAAELPVPEIAPDHYFTVSIGVAERAADVPSERLLIEHADRALFAAKQSGRNRMMSFDRIQQFPLEALSHPPTSAQPPAPGLLPDELVRSVHVALERRDRALGRTIDRTLEICRELGRSIGLTPNAQRRLEQAAQMAECGWLTVAESPAAADAPTRTAAALRERVAAATADILHAGGADPQLRDIIFHRHDSFDGSRGGLVGEAIPLGARVLGLVGAFVELREAAQDLHAPDYSAMQSALDSLKLRAGLQFDPYLVDCLANLFAPQANLVDSGVIPQVGALK